MKTALLVVLAALASSGSARAFSSVPGHADISVKPIHKTVDGVKKVVGCTVSFCVRKAGGSWDAAMAARPSVFLPSVARGLKNSQDASRNAVHDPESFKGLMLFDDVPVPDPNVVVKTKIKFNYADLGGEAAGVVSGAKLTLVTAWKWSPSAAPHVYGTVTNYDEGNEFTLP